MSRVIYQVLCSKSEIPGVSTSIVYWSLSTCMLCAPGVIYQVCTYVKCVYKQQDIRVELIMLYYSHILIAPQQAGTWVRWIRCIQHSVC
jgi:hypothetical protein